jgi:methionyl aminopeptidase
MIAGRRVTLKSRSQIEQMRKAGRIVADVLDLLDEQVRPGVTASDLDRLADEFIRRAGATPSFIGVPGAGGPYRHATCVSVDDEVVHGIPTGRRIEAGQIVSIDVGAIVNGWHGDAARSWVVGDGPPRTHELVEATRQATIAGVRAATIGNHLWDISAAVEDVALAGHFGVVREYVGHGIGSEMHEEPPVPNYRTAGRGRKLEPGLCLAIEPMFTLGGSACQVKEDGWTVHTADGSLASHWEETLVILPEGPEVLTTNDPAAWRVPL